jgi:hypothetical protein
MIVVERKKRAHNTMFVAKTKSDMSDGLGEFAVFDADGDGDIDKDDLALLSEGQRRNLYLAMPERRHTSARSKTIMMKKPDLMLTLRAYYGYGEEENEDGEVELENPEMYTNTAILTREALRFDPGILGLLDILWDVTDDNRNGTVQKEEYVTMSTKLFYVVTGDNDEEDAQQTAEEEWEHDHFGFNFLNKQRFRQSWFQLTDLWTDGLSVEEYMKFLEEIIECLTEVDKSGRRRWRGKKKIITLDEYRKRKKKKKVGDPGYSRKLWEPKERREKVKIKDADSWKAGGGKFGEEHPRWEGGLDDVMAKMRKFMSTEDKEMKAAVTRLTMRHKIRGAAHAAVNPFAFLQKGSRVDPVKKTALGASMEMEFDGEDKTPEPPPLLTFDAPPEATVGQSSGYGGSAPPVDFSSGRMQNTQPEDDWAKFLADHRQEKQRLKEGLKKEMLTLLKSEKDSIRAHREAERKLAEMKWKRHEMMLKMRAEMENKKDRILVDVEHVRDDGGLMIEGDTMVAGDKAYAAQRAAQANIYAERHRSKGRGEMVAGAMGGLMTGLEIEGDSVFEDDSLSSEVKRREMLERRRREKEARMKARMEGEAGVDEIEEIDYDEIDFEYDYDNEVDYDALLAQMEAEQAARMRGENIPYADDEEDDAAFRNLLDELISQGADKSSWTRGFRLLLEPPTLDQATGTTAHAADTHDNPDWGAKRGPKKGNFDHFGFARLTPEEMKAQLSAGYSKSGVKGKRLTTVGGNAPGYRNGSKDLVQRMGQLGGEDGEDSDDEGAGGGVDQSGEGQHSNSGVGIGMGPSYGYGHYGMGNAGMGPDPLGRLSRSAPNLAAAGGAFWSSRFDLRSQLGEEYGADFHNGSTAAMFGSGGAFNGGSGGSSGYGEASGGRSASSGGLGTGATSRANGGVSILGYGGAPLTRQHAYRERARALREDPVKRPHFHLIDSMDSPTGGGSSRGSRARSMASAAPPQSQGIGKLSQMLFGHHMTAAHSGGSRNFGGKGGFRMVLADGADDGNQEEESGETDRVVEVGAKKMGDDDGGSSEFEGHAPPMKGPKWQKERIPEVVDISENWSNTTWLRRSQLSALPAAPADGKKRRHPKQFSLDSLRGQHQNYKIDYGPEPVNKVGM